MKVKLIGTILIKLKGHNVKVLYLDQASKLQSDFIEIDGKRVPTFEIDPPKHRFEPSWFLGLQVRILKKY